jgi:glutathione S-transferase
VSGQRFVPVLVDGDRVVADSTAILLYLEESYPDPPLLPDDPEERAECLLLEDWADRTFMELTRRLAYWNGTSRPGALGRLFFPNAPAPVQRLVSGPATRVLRTVLRMSKAQNRRDEREAPHVAAIAVDRIAGRDHLVGDSLTIADIALASMSAPFAMASPAVRNDPAVAELLAWSGRILDFDKEFATITSRIGAI